MMDKDKIKYILDYHSNFMTKEEKMAWRHWSSTYKMEHSNSTDEQKERRIKLYLKNGFMTDEVNILVLLEDGIDEFRKKTANRINKENSIKFNNCFKCGRLARTPKAKQCRFCGYDWH